MAPRTTLNEGNVTVTGRPVPLFIKEVVGMAGKRKRRDASADKPVLTVQIRVEDAPVSDPDYCSDETSSGDD